MKLLSHYIEQQTKQNSEIMNWQNHMIGDRLFYSYRTTKYDRGTYPSNLHYHDYYELVIFEEGEIHYLCEGSVYYPKYGDIILIPPGRFHMSLIDSEHTHYKRHVFYLYSSAFDLIGHSALTSFLSRAENGVLFALGSVQSTKELMESLQHLADALENRPSDLEEALGLSYVIQSFYLINRNICPSKTSTASLPENILLLQAYIDRNLAQITSVSQIAEHFFYSREYVSRLFRKYFDTTISEYIMKRRVAQSQALILRDLPMIEIAYQVGFGSLSTFIRAFRSVTGMTPSEYRKLRQVQL